MGQNPTSNPIASINSIQFRVKRMNWEKDIEAIAGALNSTEFEKITSFLYRSESKNSDDELATIDITAEYGVDLIIKMSLRGVTNVSLSKDAVGPLQFGELFIEDISDRGWEQVNYELFDELEDFACRCSDIQFLSVFRKSDLGPTEVWAIEPAPKR